MVRGTLSQGWSLPGLTNTYWSKGIFARFGASIKGLTTRKWALGLCGILSIGLFFSLHAYPPQFLIGA
jgi:hypothetical protein